MSNMSAESGSSPKSGAMSTLLAKLRSIPNGKLLAVGGTLIGASLLLAEYVGEPARKKSETRLERSVPEAAESRSFSVRVCSQQTRWVAARGARANAGQSVEHRGWGRWRR